MPLRSEGGAAAEEDLAVLGIDITTSFFVSMVVFLWACRRSSLNKAAVRHSPPFYNHGQLGISLAFPPPFFSVQSYGFYVADVRVGIFTQYQATCYVSKHTVV